MHFTQNNKQTKQAQSMNVFIAGVTGVLAGAAGVTAIALSDKEIRKQVSKKADELRKSLQDWSTEKLQILERHEMDQKESVQIKIDKIKQEIPPDGETKLKN